VITPNLDKLASQSLYLPNAVSNFPVCSPFRAMLMTGKYPHSNGVLSNCNSNTTPYGNELPEDAVCWSDILKQQDYALGYIGKWHLYAPHAPYVDTKNNRGDTKWNEWCPPDRRHGFDFWYAYGTYDYHMRPMYWSTDATRDGFHFVDQWGPEHEADVAIDFIKNEGDKYRKAGQPFALVLSMNPPHTPYRQVPEKYLEPYKDLNVDSLLLRPNLRAAEERFVERYRADIPYYYAMITGVDEQVGRILDVLREQQLEDNTIVLFASDHGNCLGIHGEITKNNPYEESMRIPFMIRWPGHIEARQDDLLISVPDFYPTLLDLMGMEPSIPVDVQGTSFANYLVGGQSQSLPAAQLYMYIPVGQPDAGIRGVRNHRYTATWHAVSEGEDSVRLFDRLEDPYQLHNIAGKRPEIIKALKQELVGWLDRTGDPFVERL
jgi:arylsulfatase A-like enzyme